MPCLKNFAIERRNLIDEVGDEAVFTVEGRQALVSLDVKKSCGNLR